MTNTRKYLLTAIAILISTSQVGCSTQDNRQVDFANLFSSTPERELASDDPSSSIRELKSGESLSEIVSSASGVVLVDFYADWCGPCKKQSGVLHEFEEYASSANAQIIKVNVDTHRELASQYQVASLPTLVVLKDGQVDQTKVGFTSERELRTMLR